MFELFSQLKMIQLSKVWIRLEDWDYPALTLLIKSRREERADGSDGERLVRSDGCIDDDPTSSAGDY